MLTHADVEALLEDGPHTLQELADWLELPTTGLAILLDTMGIATCDHCSRRFLPRKGTSGHLCSRACYRGGPPTEPAAPVARPAPAKPREDLEYRVVWHGGMWH